jgi:hypothetical protein
MKSGVSDMAVQSHTHKRTEKVPDFMGSLAGVRSGSIALAINSRSTTVGCSWGKPSHYPLISSLATRNCQKSVTRITLYRHIQNSYVLEVCVTNLSTNIFLF